MSRPVPILLVSDAPELSTGLARITREICALLVRSPKWRVGTFGLWGHGSRHLPWAQYQMRDAGDWGLGSFPRVWNDFAGLERGVVMTVWDATRVNWLSRPDWIAQEAPAAAQLINEGRFQLWGYLPVDATGPGDKLSQLSRESMLGFHRLSAYTKWSEGVMARTIGDEAARHRGLTWLPHGINPATWTIRDKAEARLAFPRLCDGDKLVGIVMTNQERKDWGLGLAAVALLRQKYPNLRCWCHVDMLERKWSIPALAADLELENALEITHDLPMLEMARRYAACDLVMLPSLGEGWGFPLVEALACGVPVLTGDYAGAADWLRQAGHERMLVEPLCVRLEGIHNQLRPVYAVEAWVGKAVEVMEADWDPAGLRASTAHLWWENLWPVWQKWFNEGLQ